MLDLEGCRVDLEQHRAQRGQKSLPLTDREAALLRYMAARPNQTVSRAELEREVWSFAPGVRSRAVEATVRRLRRKIEPAGQVQPVNLQTVYGVGFRLRLAQPAAPRRPQRPQRLPHFSSRFFGREAALAWLEANAEPGALCVLLGPGGIGKTRLAIRFAEQASGPLVFCDLSTTTDPADIVPRLVAAAGLSPDLSVPLLPQLVRALAELDAPLIILDNAEQLLPQGGEVLWELHQQLRGCVLLVTSRRRPDLYGERLLQLGPLPEAAARQMLADRLRARAPLREPDPADLQALCATLEGLPLAIELAAGQSGLLSVSQINERLQDQLSLRRRTHGLTPRHQSLQAAVQWSWELLSPAQQRLLCLLAMFRGGFTVEAVSAIAPEVALSDLEALFDHSMLQSAGDGRLDMLVAIRSFVEQTGTHQRLAPTLWRRHAEHVAAGLPPSALFWPETIDAAVFGEEQNLYVALERALAHGDAALAVSLLPSAAALRALSGQRAHTHALTRKLLDAGALPPPLRLRVLIELVVSLFPAIPDEHLEELAALSEEQDDLRGRAVVWFVRAGRLAKTDISQAITFIGERLDRVSGLVGLSCSLQMDLALMQLHHGAPDAAMENARAVVRRAEQADAPLWLGCGLLLVCQRTTDTAQVRAMLARVQRCIALLEDTPTSGGLPSMFWGLGTVLNRVGDLGPAADAFSRAADLFWMCGLHSPQASAMSALGGILLLLGQTELAMSTLDEAVALCASLPAGRDSPWVLQRRGVALLELGRAEEALAQLRAVPQGRRREWRCDALAASTALAEARCGELESAQARLAGIDFLRPEPGPEHIAYACARAEVLARTGQPGPAREVAEQAVEWARTLAPAYQIRALRCRLVVAPAAAQPALYAALQERLDRCGASAESVYRIPLVL